ncbi:MAG: ATP-binding protein [Myxococcaceae bacterium]
MQTLADLPPATRKLVIVEDEAILALDLERFLRGAGYDVRGVAADCEGAVSLVEHERPDLVLMDIHLQGPQDGVATALVLKERYGVPVVYLTAHGDPRTIERARSSEPLGYLLKPFKKPDLENVVNIALARRHLELSLKRREAMLLATLTSVGDGILTADADRSVTWVNPAAAALLGGDSAAVIDRQLSEVLDVSRDGQQTLEVAIDQALQNATVPFAAALTLPNGTRSVVGSAAGLSDGRQAFGVVVTLRDLTELLEARRRLEFTERLAAIGTLAASVAHEVNNPLLVNLTNLHLVLADLPPGASELREMLQEAHAAGSRIATIVRELKSFAAPNREVAMPIDVRACINAALRFTRGQWRDRLAVVLELEDVGAVELAPVRFEQVLVNLIINAVQATRSVPSPVLTIRVFSSPSGEVVLTVEDTGPGVPPELRARIFEAFFTTKPAGVGTGLGLAVSSRIIEEAGGRFGLAEGSGAKFVITLPRVAGPARMRDRPIAWVGEGAPHGPSVHVFTGLEPQLVDQLTALEPGLVVLASGRRHAIGYLDAAAVLLSDVPEPGVVCLKQPISLASLRALAAAPAT